MKATSPFSVNFPPAVPDGKADLYSAYRFSWDIAEMALLMIAFGIVEITGRVGYNGKV